MAKRPPADRGIYPLEDKPNGKCRIWKLVVSLGRNPKTGKYDQKSRTFRGTLTEARAERARLAGDAAEGKAVVRRPWTVEGYADHFCGLREADGGLAKRSLMDDRCRMREICHVIGKMRLQDLTPDVIEGAYRALREGDSPSGRPLSGTTLAAVHAFTRRMLAHAAKTGVIAANPCDDVAAPRRDTKEKRALSPRALEALLDRLDPADPYHCAVMLAGSLGLRRGELCALSAGDIDLDARSIYVRHGIDPDGELKEPKTTAGKRRLPLTDALALKLAARLERLVAAARARGGSTVVSVVGGRAVELPAPDAPLLTGRDGGRLTATAFSSWWDAHREALGVGDLTLHELRHTFISIAAAQGVHPSVIQRLAGHSDPSITLGVYTHVNLDAKRAAVDAVEEAILVSVERLEDAPEGDRPSIVEALAGAQRAPLLAA